MIFVVPVNNRLKSRSYPDFSYESKQRGGRGGGAEWAAQVRLGCLGGQCDGSGGTPVPLGALMKYK